MVAVGPFIFLATSTLGNGGNGLVFELTNIVIVQGAVEHSLHRFRKGLFHVKSFYSSLRNEERILFPVQWVKGFGAPLRTCFFFCLGGNIGENLHIDMLMTRGYMQVNSCNLCKTGEELAYHILMHCNRSKQLWDMLLALFSAMVFLSQLKIFCWEVW